MRDPNPSLTTRLTHMTEISQRSARGNRKHRDSNGTHRSAAARLSVIVSARECVIRAVAMALPHETAPGPLYASDATFRHLNGCVREYARIMRAMGESEDRVRLLLQRAVFEALAPEEPHPAVVSAMIAWCEEDQASEG
jgi:hypothetical protein